MERIIKIEEFEESNPEYMGYCIHTDEQQILILVSTGQGCCESTGYVCSEENLDDFIGADIIDIEITDTALNSRVLERSETFEGGVMFLNVKTTKGVLQFVVYNDHNGYYGHDAKIISRDLFASEVL
jgi:hypothetical protein